MAPRLAWSYHAHMRTVPRGRGPETLAHVRRAEKNVFDFPAAPGAFYGEGGYARLDGLLEVAFRESLVACGRRTSRGDRAHALGTQPRVFRAAYDASATCGQTCYLLFCCCSQTENQNSVAELARVRFASRVLERKSLSTTQN